MKIEKTLCPYCGATLNIRPRQEVVKCDYCGSSILITGMNNGDQHTTYDQNLLIEPCNTNNLKTNTSNGLRKEHNLFPPPGFRTKNILHMLVAIFGYFIIFSVGKDQNTPGSMTFYVLCVLSTLDIFTDWTGLFSRLKGVNHQMQIIRLFAKALWSLVFVFVWGLPISFIQNVILK